VGVFCAWVWVKEGRGGYRRLAGCIAEAGKTHCQGRLVFGEEEWMNGTGKKDRAERKDERKRGSVLGNTYEHEG
jgi:hypothetical protein